MKVVLFISKDKLYSYLIWRLDIFIDYLTFVWWRRYRQYDSLRIKEKQKAFITDSGISDARTKEIKAKIVKMYFKEASYHIL